MKYFVVSDIHGSNYYANQIKEIIQREEPDQIILLGDLYYHGPRNPLTKEYNPKEVANTLNQFKEKILCVRGNCDAEVDEMISEFPFENQIRMTIHGVRFFFTHGHHENIDHLPDDMDVIVYGHFHTGFIKEKDGILAVNAGSISLPKEQTPHSYLVIDDQEIQLKDIEGNCIEARNYRK